MVYRILAHADTIGVLGRLWRGIAWNVDLIIDYVIIRFPDNLVTAVAISRVIALQIKVRIYFDIMD